MRKIFDSVNVILLFSLFYSKGEKLKKKMRFHDLFVVTEEFDGLGFVVFLLSVGVEIPFYAGSCFSLSVCIYEY